MGRLVMGRVVMGCLVMGRFECESFKSPEKYNICMYEWDITCKGCEILLQTAHTIFQKKNILGSNLLLRIL